MRLLLLFVKGERGLVANMDGLFYFPDRKSNITEEGLYDCTTTIEKETYTFVTGEPVKTEMPSYDDIVNVLGTGINAVTMISSFRVSKIGNSVIHFMKGGFVTRLAYVGSDREYHHILSYGRLPKDHNLRKLYGFGKFTDIIDYEDMKKSITYKNAMKLAGDMVKQVVASVISTVRYGGFYKINEINPTITLVDNRFIVIRTNLYGRISTHVYIYSESNGGIMKIDMFMLPDELFGENVPEEEVDVQEVIGFMVDNYIGTEAITGVNTIENDEIYIRHIRFMNEYIDVLCLNGKLLLGDISVESKMAVSKSFEELSAYRKKVSKMISRQSIPELRKLSPKYILGFVRD